MTDVEDTKDTSVSNGNLFWISKRLFDLSISIFLLPLVLIIYVVLFILNYFINPGPVFFLQYRMGKNCKKFKAIKFRSMKNIDKIIRGHNDPIEASRITPLGNILRMFRIDEMPQIINVIKGDMSLIGPRPDYYEHAIVFLNEIDGYKERHMIRPGISGLSQIRLGYAVGLEATKKKTDVDNYYIQNAGFFLDAKILVGTIVTILRRAGN